MRWDQPGIVFQGPAHDRTAAPAAGPDVWEVISCRDELAGCENERIAVPRDETEPRMATSSPRRWRTCR